MFSLQSGWHHLQTEMGNKEVIDLIISYIYPLSTKYMIIWSSRPRGGSGQERSLFELRSAISDGVGGVILEPRESKTTLVPAFASGHPLDLASRSFPQQVRKQFTLDPAPRQNSRSVVPWHLNSSECRMSMMVDLLHLREWSGLRTPQGF
jgi:hypothetical protein